MVFGNHGRSMHSADAFTLLFEGYFETESNGRPSKQLHTHHLKIEEKYVLDECHVKNTLPHRVLYVVYDDNH